MGNKKVRKGSANFVDLTNYHEKKPFLDRIFCKGEGCKMPVGPNDTRCGKCDHVFEWNDLIAAIATQARLRDENKRNRKYVPPDAYI
ncbi:MAG: hypothetical protein WCT49_04850 [Candidatus Paceibacterota bacterium]|jgi:hypothetical protein|nr:hypothetical protein [Candidatus Paceibacterota bacterium]